MKKLSIIVVNYNVCYFLEQTLLSVQKAVTDIDAEVIVVDNNSVDGSVEMVREKFPSVTVIANKVNTGFSKANNQAIRIAKGEYVLLLNPDTVVEQDTFTKCCHFMDTHPDAGGLGVKMVDGKGSFLPESKRGLPTPWVAFYKIFGLAKLFPTSRKFGKYHLGFLDKDHIHEVEVLSGAYMLLRKSVLDKIGLLDEDYFMYGEDIDLSYRIIKGGYKNYYFPETRIIHYKGESTKKSSVNYVFVFYKAMIIFARKHFNSKNAGIFSFLINIAIYLRAGAAVASRFIQRVTIPLLDASVIFTGMYFLKDYWENNHKWVPGKYPPEYMTVVVPTYIFVWLISVFFSGGYDKQIKIGNIVRGVAVGTLLISALSNFIDAYRFSKALILLGGVYSILSISVLRFLLHFLKYRNFIPGEGKSKRVVLVGNGEESRRVTELLGKMNYNLEVIGFVGINEVEKTSDKCLGSISRIEDIIEIYKADEIIFCSKDIPANQIIEWMTRIAKKNIEYKIVPDESNYIIGSNSKDSRGDFYTLNIELNIIQQSNVRKKRVLDVGISFFLLGISPILALFVENPRNFFLNIAKVISGSRSWVGFSDSDSIKLPSLKEGVISPVSHIEGKELDVVTIQRLNLLYAKDYNPYTDLELIYKSWRKLG